MLVLGRASAGGSGAGPGDRERERERERERQWREKPRPETEHWRQVKNQTDGDEESEVRVDPQATHICRPACWPESLCLEHRAPTLILCLFPGLATA